MSILQFKGVGIKGISATVPKTVVKTMAQTDFFSEKQLTNFMESTGIEERRVASKEMCASDLCYDAAMRLLEKTETSTDQVDVLIFLSQTPDYRVPGTSILMQNRLHLPKSVLAFDVNMTCSGYLYGLFLGFSLANLPNINNVLLLVGETMSKITSMRDKATSLLLGDAGSATLISKGDCYGDIFLSLNTDGSNFDAINIPMGGFRNMSSEESLVYKTDEGGNERNGEQIVMDGMEVFSFAMTELPKDVKRLLNHCGKKVEEIDKFIFHQANKMMTDFIAKKLKVESSKVLYSIHKFGNTSGTSIPLTFAYQKDQFKIGELLLLNAIGAGFSWGTMLMTFASECTILDINEI